MSEDKESRVEDLGADESVLPIGEHIEEVAEEDGRKVRHRGIYLLPNLFTTAALFSGYYAVIAGMQHRFEHAAIAIFVAMICDGLDGRVARLTNTQSAFGVQYDSLSDLVSFGVAPSLVMFNWALVHVGKFGWSAAFLYCACAALRLARFNTQVDTADKRYFTGLASPAAAAVMAGTVWLGSSMQVQPGMAPVLLALLTAATGLLMVTNLRYYSFKGVDFKGRVPFVYLLAVLMIITVLVWHTELAILSIAVLYALSGPLLHWRTRKASC